MLNAVIVDDEQLSLNKLEKLINGSGLAAVKQTFTEPLAALEYLGVNRADVIFLDIEMPDMDGIELANRILDAQGSAAIVFVTAYNQYAVEAFRLNALDYLMKPVSEEQLVEALRRAAERPSSVFSSGLQVRCFGKFSVTAEGRDVKFRTEKAEELFAFLIQHGSEFVSRGKIIDRLWEDFEGDRALTHFNTTLCYVKKALLQYGVQISIQYGKGAYRLEMRDIDCDYIKFSSCAAKSAAGQAGIGPARGAALLYRGEYLLGWETDWAAAKRLALQTEYIRLLIQISGYYKDAGDYTEAVRWLEAGLPHEPLHRELNYCLMAALLACHERAAAAEYYELYRNGLLKKAKREPDEDFQALFES